MSGMLQRAFVALPLDAAAKARLERGLEPLRAGLAGLRWSRTETLHLTLRFLGDAPGEALAALRGPLSCAAAGCPPLLAPLAGLGIFPERGAPRVLWLGLDAVAALRALQGACESAAVAAGFAAQPQPFRPHLTVGRWRGRAKRPRLPALELGTARLDTLVLFGSQLRPEGARHTPLAEWPLGAAA